MCHVCMTSCFCSHVSFQKLLTLQVGELRNLVFHVGGGSLFLLPRYFSLLLLLSLQIWVYPPSLETRDFTGLTYVLCKKDAKMYLGSISKRKIILIMCRESLSSNILSKSFKHLIQCHLQQQFFICNKLKRNV